MGAGHAHTLFRPGDTVVHRLPAQCKLVAAAGFVLVVVATPGPFVALAGAPTGPTGRAGPAGTAGFAWPSWPAFAAYALLLVLVAALARLGPGLLLRRLAIEAPFVLFAVLLPFIAGGERVAILGLSLSQSGLADAAGILTKATLGVLTAVLLATTTDIRDLLHGMARLRLPHQLVLIASFMVRYVDVIADELSRMRIARESRGFTARGVRSWPVLAAGLGALFLRSYERGERVHLAMRARGFTGRMPVLHEQIALPRDWLAASVLPLVAAVAALSVVAMP